MSLCLDRLTLERAFRNAESRTLYVFVDNRSKGPCVESFSHLERYE